MHTRSSTTALIAATTFVTLVALAPAGAQTSASADTMSHFSLFAGTSANGSVSPSGGFELGVSADLRWRPIPVPFRLSLGVSQRREEMFRYSAPKAVVGSAELIFRPVPRLFGIRPYFLGGIGGATMSAFDYWTTPAFWGPDGGLVAGTPQRLRSERTTWAFASAGLGFDLGGGYIQARLLEPITSRTPVLVPITIGFRWD
jgi:hypothetical protein